MAITTLHFFLFLSTFYLASAQTRPYNITRGSSLTPTNSSSWLSPSGLYAFGFYPRANGYGIGVSVAKLIEKTVVWTANRDKAPVDSKSILLLTSDGKLVVRTQQGDDMAIVENLGPIYSASMLDSGNFVLYNSSREVIWQSFDYPTDVILPGQSLKQEQRLVSSASENDYSSGLFCLRMQYDGNLVQYPAEIYNNPDYAYWKSDTYQTGDNFSLNLDKVGNLYILKSNVNIKYLNQGVSPKEDTIFMMRIDVDGIFRIYSNTSDQKGNWSIVWSSSNDKCDPKGFCGPNSYCILNDVDVDCICIPGFDFVDPRTQRSGCQRNFTMERCKKENENEKKEYDMIELNNTVWDAVPYSNLSSESKKDCQTACFHDCNCEAVLFGGGNCKKQRLPLRFGRRSIKETNTMFIKVGLLTDSTPDAKQSEKQTRRSNILVIGVVFLVFSFLVLAVSATFFYKGRSRAYKKINPKLGEDSSMRAFTFKELMQITKGFKEELGRGAFGTVYKGVVPHNQQVVAVKKLERTLADDGEREFQTEIKVIGRTHHRNLVRLIGYCLEGTNRLLVYEYMSNGSLAGLIHMPKNRPSWDERTTIAFDIARGVLYLHEECETTVIHCDIKPQNILMDQHMRAKISDFGLAKLLKQDETKTFTGIRGTRGYIAPEWHQKRPVTVKADVYSFGVVLFEIICCRRSVDWSLPEKEAVLEEWVYQCWVENRLRKLVGDKDKVEMKKLERMVKVGLWCIQDDPSLRPLMRKVMLMLEETVEIPVPPCPFTCFSNTI